jgi:hypothetical protein
MTEQIFSDEPLNIESDFDQWQEAPEFAPSVPAKTYRLYVAQIREEKEVDAAVGRRLNVTLDFKIIGGEYDDRSITFQRLSNIEFKRRDGKQTSFLLDLLKSAGVQQAPRSNKDFSLLLHQLLDRGPSAPFGGDADWRGFCTNCNDIALMKATGRDNAKDAKDAASSEQKKEAAKYATKAKSHRGFPIGPDGQRKDTFICKDCGNEIQAQVRVTRFTKAV